MTLIKRDEDIYIEIEMPAVYDFYREESRGALVDDDEITPSEAGFMEGYEDSEEE